MNIKTNAQGKDRKNLVSQMAEILGTKATYNGAPKFTYTVGDYTIERDGSLTVEEGTKIDTLVAELRNWGFEVEAPETENQETAAEEKTEPKAEEEMTMDSWTLTMPRADFTDAQIDNLEKILASKASLIKKALDCDDPVVILTEDRVAFPWFKRMLGSGESMAVMHFITSLCRMAKASKRVTAKEKEVPNDNYAFRCFLLRLGYIGPECKEIRKRLLERLNGSSAFRTEKKEAEAAESVA